MTTSIIEEQKTIAAERARSECQCGTDNNCGNCKNQVDTEGLRLVVENAEGIIEMGSNVSRHSGKGMSGRRTQSSGNTFHFNHTKP